MPEVGPEDGKPVAKAIGEGKVELLYDGKEAVPTELGSIKILMAQGVEKLMFVTNGASVTFLLSDLLEKGESGDVYTLTHDGEKVSLTLGEGNTDVSGVLTKG